MRKCCVEASELSYDDGETTIYLYTRGTQGRPEEELKDLLRYMENSTEENARTDSLKELHQIVKIIKSDGEVGISYMKSVEIEEKIREEGRKEGQEEGHKSGLIQGKLEEIVKLGRKFGKTDEEIKQIIQEELGFDDEEARKAMAEIR